MSYKNKVKKFFHLESYFFRTVELIMDINLILIGFYLATFIRDAIFVNNSSFINAIFEILGIFEENLILPDGPFTRNGIIVVLYGNSLIYIILCFIFIRLYETTIYSKNFKNTMIGYFLVLVIVNSMLVVVEVIFNIGAIKPESYFVAIVVQFLLISLFKYPFWKMLKGRLWKSTLVISTSDDYEAITLKIIEDKNIRDRVECIYRADDEVFNEELKQLISNYEVVHLSSEFSTQFKNSVIAYCIAERNIYVKFVPKLYELSLHNAEYKNVDDKLVFSLKPFKVSIEQRIIKRTFDITVSLIGILLTFPIMILIAIAIKIEDGGSPLFKQERVTINNKIFNICKFRSMIMNAESKTGIVQATKNDPRITKIGKFIRKTRIDELPQFFNVLSGNMSIVGPRPERMPTIIEMSNENPRFLHRTNVKGGITGYAQYKGKYTTNLEDKLRMDLYYIRNQSFLFDMKIILGTGLTILNSENAEGTEEGLSFKDKLSKKGITIIERSDKITIIS